MMPSESNEQALKTHHCRCRNCGFRWKYTVPKDSDAAKRKYAVCWDCAAQMHNAAVAFAAKRNAEVVH